MKNYATEAEAIDIIEARLLGVGCNSNVSFHSDSMVENSETRVVTFKSVIALDNAELIINHMVGIQTDTDRAITYKGSQAEPGDGGEIRTLYFYAKINPNEGY